MYRFRKDKDGKNRGDNEREAEDFAKVPSKTYPTATFLTD